MSSHETQNERLHDYLEGVLTAEDRQEFERHLETCTLCREEIHMVRRLDEVVATLPQPELPHRFMEKLSAALDEVDLEKGVKADSAPTAVAGRRTPGRRFPWWPALAAAAGLILAVGLFWPRVPKPVDSGSGGGTAAALQVWLAASDGNVSVAGGPASTTQVVPPESLLEAGQRSVLAIGKATEVRLEAGSQVKVRGDFLELSQGRIFVAERGEGLRVETPQAVVTPTGTDYEVLVEEGRTTVRVWEGRVKVAPRGSAGVELKAGEGLTVAGSDVRSVPATPDAFVEWNKRLKPAGGAPSPGAPLPKPPVSLRLPAPAYPVAAASRPVAKRPVAVRPGGYPAYPTARPVAVRPGVGPGAGRGVGYPVARPGKALVGRLPDGPGYPVRQVPGAAWRGGPPQGASQVVPEGGWQQPGGGWQRPGAEGQWPGAGAQRGAGSAGPGEPGWGRQPYPRAADPNIVTRDLPRPEPGYPGGANSGTYGPSGYESGSWQPPGP